MTTTHANCPTCSGAVCPDCGKAVQAVVGGWICLPCLALSIKEHRDSLDRAFGIKRSNKETTT